MTCIERMKCQVKGPTLRSNLKRRIGYNEVKDIVPRSLQELKRKWMIFLLLEVRPCNHVEYNYQLIYKVRRNT